jgi:hypothetical protein
VQGRTVVEWASGLLLCVLLASCSVLPGRRAVGGAAPRSSPTPTPTPLVRESSARSAYDSHHFATPVGGWHVDWRYRCALTQALSHGIDRVSVVARRVRLIDRPAYQSVVSVLVRLGPRQRSVTHTGRQRMSTRGTLYLEVRVSQGCSWSVDAAPGL